MGSKLILPLPHEFGYRKTVELSYCDDQIYPIPGFDLIGAFLRLVETRFDARMMKSKQVSESSSAMTRLGPSSVLGLGRSNNLNPILILQAERWMPQSL